MRQRIGRFGIGSLTTLEFPCRIVGRAVVCTLLLESAVEILKMYVSIQWNVGIDSDRKEDKDGPRSLLRPDIITPGQTLKRSNRRSESRKIREDGKRFGSFWNL